MSLTDLQDMKPKMNHLQSLRKVDIEDIRENIHNIFAQRDIEELKENIKKDGLLKPLEVYQDGDQYILIGGHRRYNALLELYMEDAVNQRLTVSFIQNLTVKMMKCFRLLLQMPKEI